MMDYQTKVTELHVQKSKVKEVRLGPGNHSVRVRTHDSFLPLGGVSCCATAAGLPTVN